MLTSWTAEHVGAISTNPSTSALIAADDFVRISPSIDIWDAWPVQKRDGAPLLLDGGAQLWMALAAPRFDNPDERHEHARIHLFLRTDDRWDHLGPAMPDGFSPGSREWSGSAIFDEAVGEVILYFTAAGRRDEAELTFEQRMFSARARLTKEGRLVEWGQLIEVIPAQPALYMPTTDGGQIGTIKAFRDPAYFRDPTDGRHYLFFAGSLAGSASAFNGVVGVATAPADQPDHWTIARPLLSADGVNNELERPHVIQHKGLYYLFWSTQRHVFNPEAAIGPTGLYGMVSEGVSGPWRPINGSGLVFANPREAPAQAYSWMILPDLSVTSFVDDWGVGTERRFGGSFAPFTQLWLDGDRGGIAA
ncbi:glycoside hydrolase family 68 protein [Sphingobium sp. BYY-5]|uniref:glycoside hydrolase family 68 protein n=1 Tax=Sphingobium sp. BYY-5 TaxID=2926400 RepID=UPI001FA748AA|nr:glycoside hydrolase family 68 protein [Sphingobium sp. BYY-5]MCI4591709.1 glycoside hydrolase family 68 protein [Sphingobium sp. BYY-5]